MFLLLYAVERNLICVLTRGNTQQIFDEVKGMPKSIKEHPEEINSAGGGMRSHETNKHQGPLRLF